MKVYVKWECVFVTEVEVDDDFDISQIGMEVEIPGDEKTKYQEDTFEVRGVYHDEDCEVEVEVENHFYTDPSDEEYHNEGRDYDHFR